MYFFLQTPVDIKEGIQPHQTKRVAELLGLSGKAAEDAQEQMKNLYKLFIDSDCTQVEINPFVFTRDGKSTTGLLLPLLLLPPPPLFVLFCFVSSFPQIFQ